MQLSVASFQRVRPCWAADVAQVHRPTIDKGQNPICQLHNRCIELSPSEGQL